MSWKVIGKKGKAAEVEEVEDRKYSKLGNSLSKFPVDLKLIY